MTVSVVSALIVFLCGIWLIRCAGKSGKQGQNYRSAETTPLPPRLEGADFTQRESLPRLGTGSNCALPPRRDTATQRASQRGPRGILPHQFPICPIDRQKNIPGEPQKIFWYNHENCYRCSNGHRFGSNGSIIVD